MSKKASVIRPYGNRILIRRLPPPEQSIGGIYILGREHPLIGEVLAIGIGIRSKRGNRIPITDLEVDDLVQFTRKVSRDTSTLMVWDEREVGKDTFIIDYHQCFAGMRREGENYRVWPLGEHVMIRREGISQ